MFSPWVKVSASAEYKRVETTAWGGGERPRYDMRPGYLASSASVAKFGKKNYVLGNQAFSRG